LNRTTLVETGVLIGAFLPAASSSAATKARLTVTPGGVMAGDPVKVDHHTGCKQAEEPGAGLLLCVTGEAVYNGFQGVFVTSGANRKFSVHQTTSHATSTTRRWLRHQRARLRIASSSDWFDTLVVPAGDTQRQKDILCQIWQLT
jgi:hypothetical protein